MRGLWVKELLRHEVNEETRHSIFVLNTIAAGAGKAIESDQTRNP